MRILLTGASVLAQAFATAPVDCVTSRNSRKSLERQGNIISLVKNKGMRCAIDDEYCSGGGVAHCKGLCKKHYGRLQRTGDPQKSHHKVRPYKAKPGEGWCAKCSAFKPVEQFARDSKHSDGLKTQCRECCSKAWISSYDPERDWERRLKSKYGINAAQYSEMMSAQGGVCATCGKSDGDRRLSVDHCHKTGKVRGLLCFRCNSTMGKVEESLELISSIVSYLEKHRG